MPTIRVNGADLYYEDSGGEGDAVLFVPGLVWGTRLFRYQVAALRDQFRCVTVEPRGQGRSAVTRDGYELDNLARDLAELIEGLALSPCHLVGHSLGGSVAVRVAIRRPKPVRSLALLDATADEDPVLERILFRGLSYLVEWFGMGRVDDRLVKLMLGKSFRSDPARAGVVEEARRQFLANDKVGTARAVRGWLRSPPVLGKLPRVTAPTLVVAGEEDETVKPERSRRMADKIRNARFLLLPQCGHSSPVEAPEAVTAALGALFEEAGVRAPAAHVMGR